jgi:hypothetical protein
VSAHVLPRGQKAKWKRELERWATQPSGTPVIVSRDDGRQEHRVTRGHAWPLGHGQPVIELDGIRGGFDLSRVRLDVVEGHLYFDRRLPLGDKVRVLAIVSDKSVRVVNLPTAKGEAPRERTLQIETIRKRFDYAGV